jgi:hypothetical protein
MKKLLSLAILLSLVVATAGFSGCSTTGGLTTDTQKIEASCASVSSALQVLAVASERGQLPADVAQQVVKATAVTNPVCTADEIPTLDSVKYRAFQQAVGVLQAKAGNL